MSDEETAPTERPAPANKGELFDSTIALTLYNLMCRAPGQDEVALHAAARKLQHPHLELAQTQRVLAELVRRGWVQVQASGFSVRDHQRRLVVMRDTSGDEAARGYLQGGWKDWAVRDGGSLLPIEEAILQPLRKEKR